ncbi:hypothetical protein ON010_g11849 [Phytophthora cinnamomi]|nr:hypothetical protein ON010_g11849 [Phytophthora cinnamomi]
MYSARHVPHGHAAARAGGHAAAPAGAGGRRAAQRRGGARGLLAAGVGPPAAGGQVRHAGRRRLQRQDRRPVIRGRERAHGRDEGAAAAHHAPGRGGRRPHPVRQAQRSAVSAGKLIPKSFFVYSSRV